METSATLPHFIEQIRGGAVAQTNKRKPHLWAKNAAMKNSQFFAQNPLRTGLSLGPNNSQWYHLNILGHF